MKEGLIFMGTSRFSLPSLAKLAKEEDVLAVVTQPDRPKGRGRRPSPTPVKEWALKEGLRVLQPERLDETFLKELEAMGPEMIVVAAFGQKLPKEVLELPPLGCINLHPSLLPRWRGAAPINWAIISGDERAGVTTILMDEGMDTGPILLQREVPIGEDETAEELCRRLSELGANLLLETIRRWRGGEIRPTPQGEEGATYAPMLKKGDGLLRWDRTARELRNQIRGMLPWPGSYTFWRGKRLILHRARLGEGKGRAGEVISTREGIEVACGEGSLIVEELQMEGKRKMRWDEFLRGHSLRVGEVLGD